MKRRTYINYLEITAFVCFFTISFLLKPNNLLAQDPQFSQPLYHALYNNPAQAGYGAKLKVNLAYRNQWRYNNYPAYRTTFASIESKLICFNRNSYLAIGGYGLFDQEYLGAIRNYNAQVSIATALQLHETRNTSVKLMLGLGVGLVSRSYSINNSILFETIVTESNNFDPVYDNINGFVGKAIKEDLSFGSALEIGIQKRHFLIIGASGHHLTSPTLFVGDRLNRRFTGHFLGSFAMKNRLNTKAHTNFTWQNKFLRSQTGFLIGLAPNFQNEATKDDFGFEAGLDVVLVGDVDRSMAIESFVPTIVINYLYFDFIISKDINVSTRNVGENRGGMEFTMQFKITRKDQLKKICNPSSIICPKF